MKLFKSYASIKLWAIKHKNITYREGNYCVARTWYKFYRNTFFGEKWLGEKGMIEYINRTT